jgi:hypothetical protein
MKEKEFILKIEIWSPRTVLKPLKMIILGVKWMLSKQSARSYKMKSNKKYSQTSLEWELHIINPDSHLSIDQQKKW